MKNIRYKQFTISLPIDAKTVIDYAFSIYKDMENKKIFVGDKGKNKELNNIDKAYLSLFLSLLTVNTNMKEHFYNNNVNRDTFLEFLESYNEKLVLPLEMKIIFEDEKEQIYLESFSFLEELVENNKYITTETIAAFLFKNNDLSNLLDIFFSETYNDVEKAIDHKSAQNLPIKVEKKEEKELVREQVKSFPTEKETSKEKKESSILETYGTNITEKKVLHDAIDRAQEIRNIQISLKTPSKKSVILVGEPGVGKRTIVESLAKEIKEKKAPAGLLDKQIIEIDIASILAGTSYRGQFEERVKEILDTVKDNESIILFINDIHKGINATEEENKIDFVSMLSNYLARGEISLIATTTKDAYQNIILPNNISNKLWKISVEEPPIEVVEKILHSWVDEISEITKVSFPTKEKKEFMIKAIADVTSKEKRGYFSSGNNPDLARGILERTFAIASINNHEKVEIEDLIEAIETDESLSREAREKQANSLRQTLPKISDTINANVIQLKKIKK